MQLYLMRHGAALDVGAPGIGRDEERTLSPAGIVGTTDVARGLAALNARPDGVGTSPLVRARQTAEIVARITGCARPVVVCEALAPGGRIADVLAWSKAAGLNSLLLVGHLPEIAVLTSELLAGHGEMNMGFEKAAICCVSCEALLTRGSGYLEWFMPPDYLQRLAHAPRVIRV
jgi:phosphohistidine phosphatase